MIIVGLSLVAVGIVWGVVSNLLKSSEEQSTSQYDTLFLDMKVEKVILEPEGISVQISRGFGGGTISGVAITISDGENTKVIKREVSDFEPLEHKTFSITSSEMGNVVFVKSVSVAPLIQNNVGNVLDKLESNYFSSCLTILNSGNSKGDGLYTIDVDGVGPEKPIQVYCDMTTDGGGWTLIARSVQGSSGNMGWKVNAGSVTNTGSYYSLGSPYIDNLRFNELLLGKEQTGNIRHLDRSSSNNLAKISNIPNNFLSAYGSTALGVSVSYLSDLNNGPTSYGSYSWSAMLRYIGYTDRTDVYFFRDLTTTATYGLSSVKFSTCYNTMNACGSGWNGCTCPTINENFLLFVR